MLLTHAKVQSWGGEGNPVTGIDLRFDELILICYSSDNKAYFYIFQVGVNLNKLNDNDEHGLLVYHIRIPSSA